MRRRIGKAITLLVLAGIAALMLISVYMAPVGLSEAALPVHKGDATKGAILFSVAGCASCHAGVDNPAIPSGGVALTTPAGNFFPPNLTTDNETGLGRWSRADFASAVFRGVSPAQTHYYPSFPYASYQHMRLEDVLDIWAYLRTVVPVKSAIEPSPFPLDGVVRRLVGVWKYFALDGGPVPQPDSASDAIARGRYLVGSLGRCGECHTPRNLLFVMKSTRFLKGAPHPEGIGKVPDITSTGRIGEWSLNDVASVLETGMLPDYSDDISSGGMDKVLKGLKVLPKEDLRAIAAYLKALP